MKKQIFAIALAASIIGGCQKPDFIQNNPEDELNHYIGNTLFRFGKLVKYRGPDTNGKWITSDSVAALRDDGFKVTVVEVSEMRDGGPRPIRHYYGEISQGANRYWVGKDDFTFPINFSSKTEFILGDAENGNRATYDAEGELLTIHETHKMVSGVMTPVERDYVFEKTSD